ncbi:hypothetical protein D9611_005347 [Ephemerocybe angulata]|uniref:Ankyrin n=1 Tax=Ephemerocybe angulata TaxID=980116 RepID=A0A8H5FDF6_9AGAR|nr:hypothetical protein D9611_005347 [Tulosesus angulatus]
MRRHTPSALHILVQAQTRDIEVYVAKRIAQSTRLFSILSENPDIAERFTGIIQEKSKGMFLLARLQMELVLERCATIGSLLKALETLPSGINDMYRLTMDRISSLSEEEVSLAHRTFIWILHSKENLSPEDLQHALTFSYEDKKFVEDSSVSIPVLLSICCGLVTLEEDEDDGETVVRFIHYSTQEFMKDLVFSHLPHPHDLLAVTSVACVETHLAMLTAALKSAKSAGENSVWVSDVTQHLPLLRYALHNWGHHAKICDDQRSLIPFIHFFLSNHSTCIVERYGRLAEISRGLYLAAAYDLVNLISSRTFPYSPTHGTKTPFHVAAEYGKTAALRALLENYSGVHVKDEDGRTPLHHCVLADSTWEPEVVRQLSNLSLSDTWRAFPSDVVDVNAQDKDGQSAFFEACSTLREFPIEHLNDSTKPEGRILHLFTSHPGIDLDLPDSNGDTPFSCACSFEKAGVAQFLISSLPNLNFDTRNKWGETPFMHACDASMEKMENWFLSRDPGGCHFLHQEDDEGNTGLERIVAYEGWATIRNREGRSDFDLRPSSGRTWKPENLHHINRIIRILSERATHIRVVRAGQESLPIYQLRTSRAPPSATVHVCLKDRHRRYEDERTSLMLLANYPAALIHLVSENENNPDFVNAHDIDGRCALMYACFGQDPDSATMSVKILTSCPSVNVHLRSRDGMSALDYALYSSNTHVLKFLLTHPSWSPPTIRSAVIAASQNRNIYPRALECLLNARQVQDAFSFAGDNSEDGFTLKSALLGRDGYGDIPAKEIWPWGWLSSNPAVGVFRHKESQEDDHLAESPSTIDIGSGRRTPAAICRDTIAAVKNPLTSIEQLLESHFGQTEVKDAFVWDIDVRDPDTILLINCLARRSDCYDLFHDLFGGFKRCEGYRHEACVHALIQF